jgi:hypothetical protein
MAEIFSVFLLSFLRYCEIISWVSDKVKVRDGLAPPYIHYYFPDINSAVYAVKCVELLRGCMTL